jgi:23S rRNA G2069 N7-methylase RlmK/C1962 C5-methylase RlmI
LLQPKAILLKNDNPQRTLEGLSTESVCAYGTIPEQLIIEENNAQFQIDIILSLTLFKWAFCSARTIALAEASTQITCCAPFNAAGIPQAPE